MTAVDVETSLIPVLDLQPLLDGEPGAAEALGHELRAARPVERLGHGRGGYHATSAGFDNRCAIWIMKP